MSSLVRVPTLAVVTLLVAAACSNSSAPTSSPGATSAPPAATTAAVGRRRCSQRRHRRRHQAHDVDAGGHAGPGSKALVNAYNASHKNQISLTVIPTDDYNTKVGAAAAANGLPDLLSADVVFMPNWTSAGLFQDLTARINALPFKDQLAQGAIQSSTWDGKEYGLPFVMDLSVWMYNKKLFTQAGLDPTSRRRRSLSSRPTRARSRKLGDGIHGTFFGGNCGGCEVFTWWPIIWADGQQVMSPDGKTSLLNSDEAKAVYKAFSRHGRRTAPS